MNLVGTAQEISQNARTIISKRMSINAILHSGRSRISRMRWEAPISEESAPTYYIAKFNPKKFMKIKEFGPWFHHCYNKLTACGAKHLNQAHMWSARVNLQILVRK